MRKSLFVTAALLGVSSAHQFITHFHINGKADSSCVRQPDSADPIIDLSSNAMACNVVTQYPATSKCAITPGDKIAFEWRVDRNIAPADYPLKEPGDIKVGVTDDSHKGPCAVYMKKVSDASTAEGPGDGWFKVSEDGLDSSGTFCTTRLREANAPQPGVIPEDIEPGDYLLRGEFLTLNNAGPASIGGDEQPQFYSGCVQVTVSGTSGTAKPETVSIPGYVNISSPGVIYDIWNSPTNTYSNYPVPGPKPLVFSTSSGGESSSDSSSSESTVLTSSAFSENTETPAPNIVLTSSTPVTDAPETGIPTAGTTAQETPVQETSAPSAQPTGDFNAGIPPTNSSSTHRYGHHHKHKHHHIVTGTNSTDSDSIPRSTQLAVLPTHNFELATSDIATEEAAVTPDSANPDQAAETACETITKFIDGPLITTFLTVTARAAPTLGSHPENYGGRR